MEGPNPTCAFLERSQQPSPEAHHIYLERKKLNAGFGLFLSSSEVTGVGQLKAFNQVNTEGHSTIPDRMTKGGSLSF